MLLSTCHSHSTTRFFTACPHVRSYLSENVKPIIKSRPPVIREQIEIWMDLPWKWFDVIKGFYQPELGWHCWHKDKLSSLCDPGHSQPHNCSYPRVQSRNHFDTNMKWTASKTSPRHDESYEHVCLRPKSKDSLEKRFGTFQESVKYFHALGCISVSVHPSNP